MLMRLWQMHSLPFKLFVIINIILFNFIGGERENSEGKVAALVLHFYCINVNEMPSLLFHLCILYLLFLYLALCWVSAYILLLAFSIKLLSSNDTLPH